MGAIASQHPFPSLSKQNDLAVPVLFAPSLYVIASFALYWGNGTRALLSPALLTLVGLGALAYVARVVFCWRNQPLIRQISVFCGAVMVIYGQMLLPRFWGWPSL